MIKRLNFRKKIIFSQILLFLLFSASILFVSQKTARYVIFGALSRNSDHLLHALEETKSLDDMLTLIQEIDEIILYGIAVFDPSGTVLFDSTIGPFSKEKYSSYYPQLQINTPIPSRKKSTYSIDTSSVTKKKVLYITIPFQAHHTHYILRTSFDFSLVSDLAGDFESWYLIFCVLAFCFFALLTTLFFHRINYPIQRIIKAISPYQRGESDTIAPIILPESIDTEDQFYKLAATLNSLSERLRNHIQTILNERNEKEAILESLGEGVIAVDDQLAVRYVNFIGSKMLGMPRRHLIHRPFPTMPNKASSSLFEKCRHLLHTARETQTLVTDSIALGDTKKIYIDLVAAPTTQNNGAIIVLQDKSSHYRVLEMGKDFVANASHELRTPITIIKGFAETLQDLTELPREMLVDITEKIVRNCQRMESLVKNLLTLADLENLPDSRFQECNLYNLIESCVQVVHGVYPNAQFTMKKESPLVTAFADPDILELAITNLLDNACKYSPPPAQITITLSKTATDALITVSDKGIGIPSQELEHIFDRFYTVNKAHSRRLGGAGLGLSIVKTIIEKHDGTISASSVLGSGTTFTIALPAHRPHTEDSSPKKSLS